MLPEHASNNPTLPETAWFTWQGTRVEVKRYVNEDGYVVPCPLCQYEMSVIQQANGGWHVITVAADGALTLQPSLACPHPKSYTALPREPCGWHVHITNGVAGP
jgi:hypothetical protein